MAGTSGCVPDYNVNIFGQLCEPAHHRRRRSSTVTSPGPESEQQVDVEKRTDTVPEPSHTPEELPAPGLRDSSAELFHQNQVLEPLNSPEGFPSRRRPLYPLEGFPARRRLFYPWDGLPAPRRPLDPLDDLPAPRRPLYPWDGLPARRRPLDPPESLSAPGHRDQIAELFQKNQDLIRGLSYGDIETYQGMLMALFREVRESRKCSCVKRADKREEGDEGAHVDEDSGCEDANRVTNGYLSQNEYQADDEAELEDQDEEQEREQEQPQPKSQDSEHPAIPTETQDQSQNQPEPQPQPPLHSSPKVLTHHFINTHHPQHKDQIELSLQSRAPPEDRASRCYSIRWGMVRVEGVWLKGAALG